MKNIVRNVCLGLVIMSLITVCKSNWKNKQSSSQEVFSVANMNLDVRPGDDFFEYVNGTWNSSHPIPEDKGYYNAFEELTEKNRNDLMEFVKEASANKNPTMSNIYQKISDFYGSGMDSIRIGQLNLAPLDDFFSRIDRIETINDVQDVAAYF